MLNRLKNRLLLQPKSISYERRIKDLFYPNMVAYWPLSGTTAIDTSGKGNNGVYEASLVLNSVLSPTNRLVVSNAGDSTGVSVFSTNLASTFPYTEGSIFGFFKLSSAADLTDSTIRTLFAFSKGTDDRNDVKIYKTATNYTFIYVIHTTNTAFWGSFTANPKTSWAHIAITWNIAAGRLNCYYNYCVQAAPTGSFVAWEDVITTDRTQLAGYSYAPQRWKGSMSDVCILNRELTLGEIGLLKVKTISKIVVLGDSISDAITEWPGIVRTEYRSGATGVQIRAVASNTIIDNMDAQTLASINDKADIVIIALGTNDNNGGDMNALQAKVESNIDTLRAYHTNARIFYMNVLPKWTDVGGGTPVDMANIRTAIAAACTAKGITCWDTLTTPWIDAADTSDGVHPTAGGHSKIATQIVARL